MSKTVWTFILCVTVLPMSAGSAEWAVSYGGNDRDWHPLVQQRSEGGYILAAPTRSFGMGAEDWWVAKLSPSGQILWQKTYGGANDDDVRCVQQLSGPGYYRGYYIVAGNGRVLDQGLKAWILKLKPSGNIDWQKTYGHGDWIEWVEETSDNGYVVVGNAFSLESWNYWVLRLDPWGSVKWQKAYGGPDQEYCTCVRVTADGGFVLLGETYSFGVGEGDFWLVKLNSQGAVQWQKVYGGTERESPASVEQTRDGGYMVVGSTESFTTAGRSGWWVLKLRANGSIAWQRVYESASWDWPSSVSHTNDGGYVVAGGFDGWPALLKLDSVGKILWQRKYVFGRNSAFRRVLSTSDGGYLLAGEMQSKSNGWDIFLLKLGPDGTFHGDCSSLCQDISVTARTSTASVLPTHCSVITTSAQVRSTGVGAVNSWANTTNLCSSTSAYRWFLQRSGTDSHTAPARRHSYAALED